MVQKNVVISEYEENKYACDDLPSTSLTLTLVDINDFQDVCQKVQEELGYSLGKKEHTKRRSGSEQ